MKSTLTRIVFIFLLFILLIPNSAFSESKPFIKEYTYQASDEDSKNSSRTIALREVKRLLLEELGTYLESTTEVQKFQLTKDQIVALTAGIVHTELIEEKWNTETLKYWLKAKITADYDEVIKSIDSLRKDRQKVKELEETRKRSENLLKENGRLRRELATIKGSKKQQVAAAYNKTVKNLNAFEWFEKGTQAHNAKRLEEALNAYTKAIELKPDFADAYGARGNVYDHLSNCEKAISDETKAIELRPDYAWAYYIRGYLYNKCGLLRNKSENYPLALNDLTKAIKLRPDFEEAYKHRGLIYDGLGNHKQAIKDYTKAIELYPDDADAYESKGIAYARLGDHEHAIEDYTKAIELNPDNVTPYLLRGETYKELGNYQEAIKHYSKAIELWPDFGKSYSDRGFIYVKLGNYPEAIIDLKVAARLGVKKAQEFLSKQGIDW